MRTLISKLKTWWYVGSKRHYRDLLELREYEAEHEAGERIVADLWRGILIRAAQHAVKKKEADTAALVESLNEENAALKRSNAALRGTITKMKAGK